MCESCDCYIVQQLPAGLEAKNFLGLGQMLTDVFHAVRHERDFAFFFLQCHFPHGPPAELQLYGQKMTFSHFSDLVDAMEWTYFSLSEIVPSLCTTTSIVPLWDNAHTHTATSSTRLMLFVYCTSSGGLLCSTVRVMRGTRYVSQLKFRGKSPRTSRGTSALRSKNDFFSFFLHRRC